MWTALTEAASVLFDAIAEWFVRLIKGDDDR